MPISQVFLSNTFNEFRQTTNLVIDEINALTNGTGVLVVDGTTPLSGTFTVDGNLVVTGETTTVVSSTLSVQDNMIYLNYADGPFTITNVTDTGTAVTYTIDSEIENTDFQVGWTAVITGVNPSAYNISGLIDSIDTGANSFTILSTATGTYVNGGTVTAKASANVDLGWAGGYQTSPTDINTYAHAGIFRDATDGVFKIYEGYTLEPDAQVNIDTTHSSFSYASVAGKTFTSNNVITDDVVTDGNFVIGKLYNIVVEGNTVWTEVGATTGSVGEQFEATATGSNSPGTGTAREAEYETTAITISSDFGDLVAQRTYIDFVFTDDNSNETPQVRIGAQVGDNDKNADGIIEEGHGAFVIYTNNADTGAGAAGASLVERMRVDHLGNVGIGTNNPATALDVVGTSAEVISVNSTADGSQINFSSDTTLTDWIIGVANDATEDFIIYQSAAGAGDLRLYTDGKLRQEINANGDISFYDSAGALNRLFWDASEERLGIGTTTPASAIELEGVGNATNITLDNTTATTGRSYSIRSGNTGNLDFYDNDATIARVTIDSSGNVGIGTANPATLLDLKDTTPTLRLTDDRDIAWTGNETLGNIEFYSVDTSSIGAHVTGFIKNIQDRTGGSAQVAGALSFGVADYDTAAAEAMRIDSSGTVIVNNGGTGNGLIKINGATGSTEALIFQRGGTEASRIGHSNSADLTFFTGSGVIERMRIDSVGNVGIGVTPSAWLAGGNLEFANGANIGGGNYFRIYSNSYIDSGSVIRYRDTAPALRYQMSNGSHIWENAASGTAGDPVTFTQAMTLDTSGNVGIGVVPETWLSTYDALQIGASGVLASISSGNENVLLMSNAYLGTDGNYKYIATNEATRYTQSAGVHYWFNAASGTADTNITFNQAMTLDASGNLLVGSTSYDKDVNGVYSGNDGLFYATATPGATELVASFNRKSTDGGIIRLQKDGTTVGSIGTSSSSLYIGKPSGSGLMFQGGNTIPVTGSSAADATYDLGASGVRFKDLYLSGTTYSSGLNIESTGNTTVNAITLDWEHLSTDVDIEQRIQWRFGDDATADGFSEAAYIGAGKEAPWNVNSNRDSYLAFGTTLDNASAERMRITSDGKVGIERDNPTSNLHVYDGGNTGVTNLLTLETYRGDVSTSFAGNAIVFRNSDTNASTQARIKVGGANDVGPIGLNSENDSSFIFETGESQTAPTSNISVNATTNIITVVHTAFTEGLSYGQKVAINAGGFAGSFTVESVNSATEFTASSTTGIDYTAVATDTTARSLQTSKSRDSMIIRSDGNVGIGTNSPTYQLEIDAPADGTDGILVTNANANASARAGISLRTDGAALDMYSTSATYNGVSGWADSGVVSTSTGTSGGLKLNAQTSGIYFQTNAGGTGRNSGTKWNIDIAGDFLASGYGDAVGSETLTAFFRRTDYNHGRIYAEEMVLSHAPEQDHVTHPYLMNDLANFVQRGGTFTKHGVDNVSAGAIRNVFRPNAKNISANASDYIVGISNATFNTTYIEYTTSENHNLYAGEKVTVSGTLDNLSGSTFDVTDATVLADSLSANTFRVAASGITTTWASAGTATTQRFVITLSDLPAALTYGGHYGISFGTKDTFHPEEVKVEVSNNNESSYTTVVDYFNVVGSIASATFASDYIEYTTVAAHGLVAGQSVLVDGTVDSSSGSSYDKTATVLVRSDGLTATAFRVTSSNPGTTHTANTGVVRAGDQERTLTSYVGYFSAGASAPTHIRYTIGRPKNSSTRLTNLYAYNYNSNGMEDYFISEGGEIGGNGIIETGNGATASINTTTIFTYDAASTSGADIVVTATDTVTNERHIMKMLITHDANNTAATATQYGSVFTNGELADFDVSISGADVIVTATAYSTNSTTYKIMGHLLTN